MIIVGIVWLGCLAYFLIVAEFAPLVDDDAFVMDGDDAADVFSAHDPKPADVPALALYRGHDGHCEPSVGRAFSR